MSLGAAENPSSDTTRPLGVINRVREVAINDLRPLAAAIDENGTYPADILRKLGSIGAFAQHHHGKGEADCVDLGLAIRTMSVVAEECLATGFCVWCQDAFGWYLQNTENQGLRARLQDGAATGAALGGTGLSNPMKALSGMEPLRLRGQRVAGGYRVDGVLPWVSNIKDGHFFGACFSTDEDSERVAAAIIRVGAEGVTARRATRFIALEGTATKAVTFQNAFIPDEDILADPLPTFLRRVRPGFVLLQTGMAAGLIRDCVSLMRALPERTREVNSFSPVDQNEIEDRLMTLEADVLRLAATPTEEATDFVELVLRARLEGAHLALDAAQASMLHAGARAYIEGSVYSRRLREAYFIAIVTPAIKHLRKDLAMERESRRSWPASVH
jgi:alkylation response protein AidB-like acyl-CoA dehydrogenase